MLQESAQGNLQRIVKLGPIVEVPVANLNLPSIDAIDGFKRLTLTIGDNDAEVKSVQQSLSGEASAMKYLANIESQFKLIDEVLKGYEGLGRDLNPTSIEILRKQPSLLEHALNKVDAPVQRLIDTLQGLMYQVNVGAGDYGKIGTDQKEEIMKQLVAAAKFCEGIKVKVNSLRGRFSVLNDLVKRKNDSENS